MLPLNVSAVVAGQLLGTGIAAGLNLYATVAVLGTATRLGLVPPLPPGLRGLSNALVIGSAAGLFLGELVIEKLPVVGALWSGAHALVRPLAAGLLTFLAFSAQPLEIALGLSAAIALIAFAANGAKNGLRVILASAPRRRAALHAALAALLLDLLAVAIAMAALLYDQAAVAVGAGSLALLALLGPRLWRAAMFGVAALRSRLAGFFGLAGWRTRAQLPWRVRRVVPPPALGQGEPRAARVAALGLPGVAAYRCGWLLLDGRGRSFVFRRRLRFHTLGLPPVHAVQVFPAPMADVLRAAGDPRGFTLFLLKDGPSAENAVAELTRNP